MNHCSFVVLRKVFPLILFYGPDVAYLLLYSVFLRINMQSSVSEQNFQFVLLLFFRVLFRIFFDFCKVPVCPLEYMYIQRDLWNECKMKSETKCFKSSTINLLPLCLQSDQQNEILFVMSPVWDIIEGICQVQRNNILACKATLHPNVSCDCNFFHSYFTSL